MREEYVTDVPYLRGFEKDLSPATLRLVAALNGFPPPPAEEFEYCELGCAHGDTLAALAASYPRARFLGVDLNADHVAAAIALAAGAQLRNARFLERDFERLAPEDVGSLDYIAAHGVLSWVGPAKRRAALLFASSALKPGGLLYVSYNTLPGWAAVEPLRQLIVGRSDLAEGSSIERARAGVQLARRMSAEGAEYFRANPAAKAMLSTIDKLGLAYVVHEYLHAHWVPFYFAQVATEMAEHDLYYVGQTPLFLNYRDLSVPASLAALFQGVGDRVTFESLKDFAINESFRRDVYVKGRPARDEAVRTAYLDAGVFGAAEPGTIARTVPLPFHTLQFLGPLYDALIPALERGATTLAALAGDPQLVGFGLSSIREGVLRLVLAGELAPMVRTTTASALPEGDLTVPLPYNHWILHHGVSGESPVVLASAAAGNGVELSALDAVAVVLLTDVPAAERAKRISDMCRRESFQLKVKERAIVDPSEQERVLLEAVERVRVEWGGRLLELGIVRLREGLE